MRPSRDEVFSQVAQVLSERSTCRRRKVGCVLTDKKGHILSTGYNGVPEGMRHCIDDPCDGAESPSGTNLEGCSAIHAEQNALLQCSNVDDIHNVYVTTFPCHHCIKLLCNTGAMNIRATGHYPGQKESISFWLRSRKGRKLI